MRGFNDGFDNLSFSEMTANDLRRIELEIEYKTVAPSCNNVLNSEELENVDKDVEDVDNSNNSEKVQENNYTIAHNEEQL